MALTLPFKRTESVSALQSAVGVLEPSLPSRRTTWWERPFAKPLVAVIAASVVLATLTAWMLRQRAAGAPSGQEMDTTLGLASTRTEAYDAHRAEEDGGVDSVQQATKESFPASDPPVWGSGPDVPIIREGEHKEELPYQQR